jgi:hypothetical protein
MKARSNLIVIENGQCWAKNSHSANAHQVEYQAMKVKTENQILKDMLTAKSQTTFLVTALFLFVPPVMLVPPTVLAQSDISIQRVQFQQGATSATIEGSIEGYQTVDYVLNAREGQYMNVSMSTDNDANYFNILSPGETQD